MPKFVQIPGNPVIVQVSAGPTHSLALSRSGSVFIWGFTISGSTSQGQDFAKSPVLVSFPRTEQPEKIIAGYFSSYVITKTRKLYSWGINYANLLGDRLGASRDLPAEVDSHFLLNKNIVDLSCSTYCIAHLQDNSLTVWGQDSVLIANNPSLISINPKVVPFEEGINGYMHAEATHYTLFIITNDNNIYVTGSNAFGMFQENADKTLCLTLFVMQHKLVIIPLITDIALRSLKTSK